MSNIIKKIGNEYKIFNSYSHNMRVLLITNMLYAIVLPIIELFVAAYIMRNSHDPALVAIYQLCLYTGIPFTFLINGFLLNKYKVAKLYSFGMLLSGVSMIFMMSLSNLNVYGVGLAGLLMGSSFGFFWSNRDLLALNSTNDENRNYYYGVETFFYTITSIVIPFFVGWFLIEAQHFDFVNNDISNAYKIVTLFVFILTIFSSYVIHQGKYENPKQKKFLYFKFDKLWTKMQALASLKGIAQGYLVTAPAILIMTLVGEENSLGTIQAVSGILTALLLYFLGRFSKPKHRITIFTVGLIIFVIGTFTNAVLFSAAGVIVFMLAKVLFLPLHDIAYFPIQMRVIDVLHKKENRNEYAYIFSHEFGLYIGRFFGLGLFLLLAYNLSMNFALKYSLLIIAVIQLLAIPMAKIVIKHTERVMREE